MGEFADLAFDRDLNRAFNEYDSGDDPYAFKDDIIFVESTLKQSDYSCEYDYHHPIETNPNYSKIDTNELVINDEWLLRSLDRNKNNRINKVIKIINITEKCIIFEYVEEWTNIYNWNMKGLRSWIAKSIIYKQKNEKKVLYIPFWADVPILNPPGPRKRHYI